MQEVKVFTYRSEELGINSGRYDMPIHIKSSDVNPALQAEHQPLHLHDRVRQLHRHHNQSQYQQTRQFTTNNSNVATSNETREAASIKKKRRGRHPRQSLLTEKLRTAVLTFTSSVGAPIVQPGGFRDFNGWLQKISQSVHRRSWISLSRTFLVETSGLSASALSDLKKDIVHEIIANVVKRSPHESVKLVSTNARRQSASPSNGITVMTIFESYLQALSGINVPDSGDARQREIKQNYKEGSRFRPVSPVMNGQLPSRTIQPPFQPYHAPCYSSLLHKNVEVESGTPYLSDVSRLPWTRNRYQQHSRVNTSTLYQNNASEYNHFTGTSHSDIFVESVSSNSSSSSRNGSTISSLLPRAAPKTNMAQTSNMDISSLLVNDDGKSRRKQDYNSGAVSSSRNRAPSSLCKPRLPSLSQLDEQLRQQLQKRDFYWPNEQ